MRRNASFRMTYRDDLSDEKKLTILGFEHLAGHSGFCSLLVVSNQHPKILPKNLSKKKIASSCENLIQYQYPGKNGLKLITDCKIHYFFTHQYIETLHIGGSFAFTAR